MVLPHCHDPIWAIDDFSRCFQRNFLQLIFPLTACGISLLLVLVQIGCLRISSRRKVSYTALPGSEAEAVADGADVDGNDNGADDGEEESAIETLKKNVSQNDELRFEWDRPRGEVAIVVLEAVAVLGLVALFAFVIATSARGRYGLLPAVAGLVAWSYVLFLVFVRLLLSMKSRHSSLRLWNHTAALYGLLWFLNLLVFRSAIIHPSSRRAVILSIIEFALSSLLLVICLTTRRGNKPVLVPHINGLEPPRHPMASLLSLATFSWFDPLIWKGYWQPLELEDVWNLTISQQATNVVEDFRRKQKKGSLTWRLAKYFYVMILVQGAWTIFSNLFTFLPTLLLKAILEYVEDPRSTTAHAAWLYAILLFCSSAIQGIAAGQALWIGRRLGVKLRAIIIGEVYAKALRRKAGATGESGDSSSHEKPSDNKSQSADADSAKDKKSQASAANEAASTQANIGTIINLMAIDSFKVSEVGAYLHFLWASVPVQIIIAVTLLYRILGFSSFAGILLMVLVLPLNVFIAKQFSIIQNKILSCTDARIHVTNEVLQNIRIIKYFAWEPRFQKIVNEKRSAELKSLLYRYMLWSVAATVWYGTPILITFTSFFLYTVVEKKQLTPSIAFPALSMFSLLRLPLDQLADMVAHVQESKVSLDRVQKYLDEDETEKYDQLRDSSSGEEGAPVKIGLDRATLTWGVASKKPDPQSHSNSNSSGRENTAEAFRLINIAVDFHVGRLNIIAGPTGAGKTSLLMALLGEMKLLEGRVHLPGGTVNRAKLPVDPETGLMESVAYCSQEAWLVNDTIKENIIFASPFDQRRYDAVIKACALERDLEILDAGDQTLVGEKGISLSGGQKQRISLARAIYSRARHLLLDDCLSAVDSHTAKHLFREALMGPLMMNRTCILVTHNVALTLSAADYVVVMDNGKVAAQGSPEEVVASGALGDELHKSLPASKAGSRRISRVPSDLEEQRKDASGQLDTDAVSGAMSGTTAASPTSKSPQNDNDNKLKESKAVGSIKISTVTMYLRAMGPWYYWILALTVFFLQQFGSVATNLWIRQWANAYHTELESKSSTSDDQVIVGLSSLKFPSFNAGTVPRMINWATVAPQTQTQTQTQQPVVAMLGDDVQVSYYLGVYAILGLIFLVISLLKEAVLFLGSLHASRKIHERLLRAVVYAKFKFFDSTPLGQIMNRFSKDVEAVDQEVAPVAIGMVNSLASAIMTVVLISVITPEFLIAGIIILLVFSLLGSIYLNASRDLKRLESVQRSPLYQQFGETLNGVVTIRAYGDNTRFIHDNHRRINSYNRPHIYLWASNRWLAFRVELTGALVSFFSAAFVLMNVGKIDAGAAGLSLTYAVTFAENILWLVRLYSQVQQDMNSVERVREYLEVDQEAPAVIEGSRPPEAWPQKGAVKFVNYTTRYRPDLEPVLKNVSFSVQPGEKVGIVGRTGAGKSSLALALFRGLEAEKGQVIIDDVDISRIGLRDLREAITIVPQDPTLFTGTIRSNLDPFELFTDEQIFTALRRVHLIGAWKSGTATPVVVSSGPSTTTPAAAAVAATTTTESSAQLLDIERTNSPATSEAVSDTNKNVFQNLSSAVSESGSNLSQGQRQLLCLARALLKNPRVLMMDEATASIDYSTDAKIQETLRELRENTIITIAHRLQTIIDYDKVLVLDQGQVIEFDHPWTLINKQDGLFRSMCANSGNMDLLVETAKKAWEHKRLVDDS